jgi:phosphoribosylformylglycinamidine cyclo-ligase
MPADRLLVGQDIRPGDAIVGIASSGIHSNGLTLARRILFDQAGLRLDGAAPGLSRPLGDELIQPTRIYVREAMQMIDEGLAIKAFVHITSDGLLNLNRVVAEAGFVISDPMEPQPIFSAIQKLGDVPDSEMYRVFNMGTGLCVVADRNDTDRVLAIAAEHGSQSKIIGYTVADPERKVWVPRHRLLGKNKGFSETREAPPAPPA